MLIRLLLRKRIVDRWMDLEIWSLDEARVGLRVDSGRRITVRGIKPVARILPGYRFAYMFGAVNLNTGASEFLEAEGANSTFFQHFLYQIANVNPLTFKVVLIDNAGYHKAKHLRIPPNVGLFFLPPYTPELNPIERFWQELRREFKGRVYERLESLLEETRDFLNTLDPKKIQRLVSYPIYENAYRLYQEMSLGK